jgi:excinuclease ABC subunit A
VESLSAYARQFLARLEKPDVDSIDGLSPAIAIEQKAASHNPRSTVGTVTEIHDYLRLLYARVGTAHCPNHPEVALNAQSVSQMVDNLLLLPKDSRLMILAPVIKERKGEFIKLFEELQAQGFLRVRIDGALYEIEEAPQLSRNQKHTVEVVVDRLRLNDEAKTRLAESLETALRLGNDKVLVVEMDTGREHLFSARFSCPLCDFSLPELEPRLFSFNNPVGACPKCDGLGVVRIFSPESIVVHPELSLASGAVPGWDQRNPFYFSTIKSLARHYGFDPKTPFAELPEHFQKIILYGSGKEKIHFEFTSDKGTAFIQEKPFEGIINAIERRYRETESEAVREELSRFILTSVCPECGGARLRQEARHVMLNGKAIHEVCSLPLTDCLQFFGAMSLSPGQQKIANRVFKEITSRLQFLVNVGLDYLSLDRAAETLSGGEAQRIRLASQIGSGLTGVLYVLDEPSIGLHQRDNERLIATLKMLRDLGNSVIVVEHDEETIESADFVVDMGPGAGAYGGEVVALGHPSEVMQNPRSLTGQYLLGIKSIAVPEKRRPFDKDRVLRLEGARGNNLRHVSVEIPVGCLTVVTGVSGSGKSTLINDTLYRAMAKVLWNAKEEPAPFTALAGSAFFERVIDVDQTPIGRTPRSNPATYTGLFTPIRELFASTQTARERGYSPGRFSFNVKGGRCEACQGDGVIRVEMHFLPDVYLTCEVCHGRRYNRETLEVFYRGRTIADVLAMSVEEARSFFADVPVVSRKLEVLAEVGLNYITLGQAATTLSGGEAQRVKLALELSKRSSGKTLYILDEPTTGLHFHDVAMLIAVLQKLVDQGNTIVVIEHNLDVIKSADWIIDLGPEGGNRGGEIVVAGTPEMVAEHERSHTGRFLKKVLAKSHRVALAQP